MTLVRLDPTTPRSQVMHSNTEPLQVYGDRNYGTFALFEDGFVCFMNENNTYSKRQL